MKQPEARLMQSEDLLIHSEDCLMDSEDHLTQSEDRLMDSEDPLTALFFLRMPYFTGWSIKMAEITKIHALQVYDYYYLYLKKVKRNKLLPICLQIPVILTTQFKFKVTT